jgi:hypothetical protein
VCLGSGLLRDIHRQHVFLEFGSDYQIIELSGYQILVGIVSDFAEYRPERAAELQRALATVNRNRPQEPGFRLKAHQHTSSQAAFER